MKVAIAIVIALLLSSAAFAQDVNWNVVLTAAGSNYCQPLTSETINGQPFDLSNGAGGSMEVCPWVYNNSSDYGEYSAQVPPTQPWDPTGEWYQWNVPAAQVSRGTPQSANNGDVYDYVETDTFTYIRTVDFYQLWYQTWNGTLVRNLKLQEKCGRWPCTHYIPPAQCTKATNCSISYKDVSSTTVLTGSFPVPTPPAAKMRMQDEAKFYVAVWYPCGSKRSSCLK